MEEGGRVALREVCIRPGGDVQAWMRKGGMDREKTKGPDVLGQQAVHIRNTLHGPRLEGIDVQPRERRPSHSIFTIRQQTIAHCLFYQTSEIPERIKCVKSLRQSCIALSLS